MATPLVYILHANWDMYEDQKVLREIQDSFSQTPELIYSKYFQCSDYSSVNN